MSMTKRFDDQVAIITGGGSGLGKAIAHRLAREGAMVYIFDQDESVMTETTTEFEKEGLLFNSYHVDITDELSVQKQITAVYGQHQRLDVMVNCAGIIGPHGNNQSGEGRYPYLRINFQLPLNIVISVCASWFILRRFLITVVMLTGPSCSQHNFRLLTGSAKPFVASSVVDTFGQAASEMRSLSCRRQRSPLYRVQAAAHSWR